MVIQPRNRSCESVDRSSLCRTGDHCSRFAELGLSGYSCRHFDPVAMGRGFGTVGMACQDGTTKCVVFCPAASAISCDARGLPGTGNRAGTDWRPVLCGQWLD